MDPLAGSSWSTPSTVAGFIRASPNATLLDVAGEAKRRQGHLRVLDVGCGAGRNGLPLALDGCDVLGIDLSWPMLQAAAARARQEAPHSRLQFALAPMDRLPVADTSIDFVVAHGAWNLARSDDEMRRAMREAGRVARPGAGLFVFTFSRETFSPAVEPIPGERFVFTHWSGDPQCFLTQEELVSELEAAGFVADSRLPLREHNHPRPGALVPSSVPVIHEGLFRRHG